MKIDRLYKIISVFIIFFICAGSLYAEKWIIFSPALTDMVFFLDSGAASKQLAAVDSDSRTPVAIARAGSYLRPDYELLIRIRPDRILFQGRNDQLKKFCAGQKINFESIKIDSIGDILNTMKRLSMISIPAQKKYQKWLNDYYRARKKWKLKNPPTVFLAIHDTGIGRGWLSAAEGTWINELLNFSGGINILKYSSGWVTANMEQIIMGKPEYIIMISEIKYSEDEKNKSIKMWKKWLPHVKVRYVTGPAVLIPGPELIQTGNMLHEVLEN